MDIGWNGCIWPEIFELPGLNLFLRVFYCLDGFWLESLPIAFGRVCGLFEKGKIEFGRFLNELARNVVRMAEGRGVLDLMRGS